MNWFASELFAVLGNAFAVRCVANILCWFTSGLAATGLNAELDIGSSLKFVAFPVLGRI